MHSLNFMIEDVLRKSTQPERSCLTEKMNDVAATGKRLAKFGSNGSASSVGMMAGDSYFHDHTVFCCPQYTNKCRNNPSGAADELLRQNEQLNECMASGCSVP